MLTIISAYILFSLVIFMFFLVEVKRLKINNAGLENILGKSEEKRIEAEKIKNKILVMIDDLPEGVLIIDQDDKISVINSRAEKFLCVNKKKVLNKAVLELGNLSNVKKIVFPLLLNFKGDHKEEIEIKKNFILDLTIEPLILGKNNTAKLIILNDVTKVKQAEMAKNQFLSVAAHQLKSPLSAARLSIKMLLAQDFGKINKEQRDILEKTYKKNESLIYLVEDLLNQEKIDEGANFDNRAMVNLENLVDQISDFYKDEIKDKKIDFNLNKPNGKLPEILADEGKIKMVLQNLFDNAIKYTPPKGKIEVSIISRKEGLEFEIKDSGMGIPENQKEKIFTRFFRTANVVKAKTAGSGLGLAIAKDIIERHHGKIWFQSKENEGSTFFFSLPFSGK